MGSFKRVSAIIMAVCVMLCLTSCTKSKDVVYTLNGVELHKKDVDIMGYIYVSEHSLVDEEHLTDYYDNTQTYEEHYKNDLEQDIILTGLLSKEADENGVLISSDDKKNAKDKAQSIVEQFGKDELKEKNIEKADIEKIYEMRIRANSYAKTIDDEYDRVLDASSADDFESDKSKDSDSTDNSDTAKNNDSDDRYVNVFQVTFPTAVFNDDGTVKTDKNGEIVRISSDEINDMKERASDFSDKAKSGEDIEKLLKDESDSVKGVDRTLKYEDLKPDYKKAVDSLSENGISGVIEGEYGFYIIKLLNKNDEDHANAIKDYEKQQNLVKAQQKLYEKLLNTYVGSDKEYRNDKLWKEVSIRDYLK